MSKPITFITGNAKKLEEINAILGNTFPRKLIVKNLDLPEFQGDIDFISIEKCKAAARLIKAPVMVEDTALCFKALGYLPGPYIKWFLFELGAEGLSRMLDGFTDKRAECVCTFAYHAGGEDDEVMLFQASNQGQIVRPRGPGDFGWDPIFLPNGYDKTFAELSKEEKNSFSYRRQAILKVRDYLISNNEN